VHPPLLQAFGARNYAVLGEVQQRARLICWTICLPIALLWWFMEPVLVLLGQEAELARLAAINMRIMIPSLFVGKSTPLHTGIRSSWPGSLLQCHQCLFGYTCACTYF